MFVTKLNYHTPQPTKPEATADQPTTEVSRAYMKFKPDFCSCCYNK